jgi:hypothetical protein
MSEDEIKASLTETKNKKRSRKNNKWKKNTSTNYIQAEGALDNLPETTITTTASSISFKKLIKQDEHVYGNTNSWVENKANLLNIKLDFDDIQLVPAPVSTIRSRKVIDIMVKDTNAYGDIVDYLPLIASPMDTLISIRRGLSWNPAFQLQLRDEGFKICYPRGCELSFDDNQFYSLSLAEFGAYLEKYEILREFANKRTFVLIDMANGHMQALIDAIKLSKSKFPEITLMVGNIGHPDTYTALSEAGADYIRVGIGNGGGCLTTQQTAIGYPMASLVRECYELSLNLKHRAKIVADGGFKKYSDIIKAISLGADYVMLGSIINKCVESDTMPMAWGWLPMPNEQTAKFFLNYKFPFINKSIPLYKTFRGMSTKEVQKSWGSKELKTSEGVTRYNKVEYTLEGWTDNFKAYLKSAMSYQNCRTIEEFRGSANYVTITQNAHNRFKK